MVYKIDDIVVVSGKRGSGKSYLTKYLVEQYAKIGDLIIILDINDEYDDLKDSNVEIIKIKDKTDYIEKINKYLDYAMKNTHVFLVLEDIDLLIDQYKIPESILNSLQIGRHRDIGMLFIFRRMNSIHKQVLFNTTHFYIFKSKLFLDRDYFAKQLNGDFDIINLNQYEFRYINAITDTEFTGRLEKNKIRVIE